MVKTLNVADVAPEGMTTVAGTGAVVEFDVNDIVSPPVGAAPFSETVPTAVAPPATGFGLIEKFVSAAGVMVRVVETCDPLSEAVKVAMTDFDSPTVVTVKVPVVAPAATVTVAGMLASCVVEESATTVPPAGATLLRVTVPVTEFPPTTVGCETETSCRSGFNTLRVAV